MRDEDHNRLAPFVAGEMDVAGLFGEALSGGVAVRVQFGSALS